MRGPALVILNPVSGNGRADRLWRRLGGQVDAALPGASLHWTTSRGDAARRVAEWIGDGLEGRVVVVGGDGTVHEVVNGMWTAGRMLPLSVIPAGTGNDFVKNAGLPPDPAAAVAALAGPGARRADLGHLEFTEPVGTHRRVVFLNSASLGVSPSANRYAQRLGRLLPGRLKYAAGGVLALLRTPRRDLTTAGAGVDYRGHPLNLTFANGQSFGGGMRIAPGASVFDGSLDLVTIGAMPTMRALLALSRLYGGGHLRMPEVSLARLTGAATVGAPGDAGAPLHLEADGQDYWARDEVTVRIEPSALELAGSA